MTSINFTAFRSFGMISGLCLALLAPSIAKAECIDTFTENISPSVLIDNPGGGASVGGSQGGLASVFNGAVRDVSIESTSGPLSAKITVIPSMGLMSVSADDFSFAKMILGYTGLGGFDLGADQLVLNIASNDNGGKFTVSYTDTALLTRTGMAVLGAGVTGNLVILLAGTGLSSDVDDLVITYESNEATDLSFGICAVAVPEPSSLAIALTGLGLAGMYFRRRRNQLTA